jgi:hypothetical protein
MSHAEAATCKTPWMSRAESNPHRILNVRGGFLLSTRRGNGHYNICRDGHKETELPLSRGGNAWDFRAGIDPFLRFVVALR